MNKARRNKARKRRHWARVKRLMQDWTRTHDAWKDPPKRGVLHRPVLALRDGISVTMQRAHDALRRAMDPVMWWGRALPEETAEMKSKPEGR